MSSPGFGFARRGATFVAVVVLALCFAGDRGRAASVPATVNGQDPLEVLQLKVRPNVLIVLDSSGSMKWATQAPGSPSGNYYPPQGSDHPRSKFWQAKQVLKQLIQQNQDAVSFMFAQYDQGAASNIHMSNTAASTSATTGANRFSYSTYACAGACPAPVNASMHTTFNNGLLESPHMTTTQLSVADDFGGSGGRGLQSWQVIYPAWNTLYFGENNGAVKCTAALTGTLPRFYTRGGSGTSPATSTAPQNLAYDLQTAMNSASCTGTKANTYAVSYNTAAGTFTFAASGFYNFQLYPATTPNNIAKALGSLPATVATATTGGGTITITPTVTKFVRSATYTTVTTSSNPVTAGLVAGDSCVVNGVAAPNAAFNGTWTTSNVTATGFRLSGPTGAALTATTGLGTTTCSHSVGASAGTTLASTTPYTLLYRPNSAATFNSDYGGTGWSGLTYTNTETVASTVATIYTARAQRFLNGETIRVLANGQVCGMTFPTAAERTNPPTFTLQEVSTCGGADVAGSVATFRWGGAYYDEFGTSSSCNGMKQRISLVPCDLHSPAPTQFTTASPWLANEFPLDATGMPDPAPVDPTTGNVVGAYTEAQDGSWGATTYPPNAAGGIKDYGSTPIAGSLANIRTLFGTTNTTGLWGAGQAGATAMAGPPPYKLDPIKNHVSPKEKTIVLFVTDGEDTCAGGDNDINALTAAYQSEQLYKRIVATEPASSVQTYMIGFGGSFVGTVAPRLNWIAWGGSGLGSPAVSNNGTRWTPTLSGAYNGDCSVAGSQCANLDTTLKALKVANCPLCQDALLAPDAATLGAKLQSIIDQGASDGDFNAQQSITESVFEYVDIASAGVRTFDARSPSTRYEAIVPTRFVSSFSLPGFNGQLKAYQNDGPALATDPCDGTGQCKWSAGDKLTQKVSTGMGTCNTTSAGGGVGQCVFSQLHAGTTDATISGSTAAIQRRIYTTSGNGVYNFTPTTLIAGTAASRLTLWPPSTSIAPNDYTSLGLLDAALGLPTSGTPTCTLRTGYATCTDQVLADLQTSFHVCTGTNLPAACTSATASVKLLAARREVRDAILGFMAGAQPIAVATGLKRSSGAVGTSPTGSLLFQARTWVLADSEMATAGVVTPPSIDEPSATPYVAEYKYYRDGPRDANGKNPDSGGVEIQQGFGLSQPDNDNSAASGANDTRTSLKPVMTVVYVPANDMLHAFRAGPNCSPAKSGCTEKGGEELWGFVPYDQLGALNLRLANDPQGRSNHVFMLTRGVRFGDVFVPGAVTNLSMGGLTVPSLNGVWRRILYFGRGIGGKYVTALDVTAPGAYTTKALLARGPIPLWSRGNPDTQDGTAAGTANGSASDKAAYAKMGETWSMPTLAYVNKDKTNPIYQTARRPNGVDFAIFMGSGYGAAGEGTTHYTLDALSGDVIAAVDVEVTAQSYGIKRVGLPYANAIVANSVSFNRVISDVLKNNHPWTYESTRVYVGDLHGHVWKFLTARPDVAIPVADLGSDQPVATAVALLTRNDTAVDTKGPLVFVSSGADKRAAGPFRNFSLRDDGTDTGLTTTGTTVSDGVTAFTPVVMDFARTFDQGTPEANCGYTTEAVFRGTVQPSGAFECSVPIQQGKCTGTTLWRIFFAGTRLSLPNTKFAPPTTLACGTGSYPCRSQFDSIIYALGAETGAAAYDLNASGDNSYRIFRDSRIAAIGMQADPDPNRGGSRFVADEGLMKGTPKAPPPPGVPPTAQTATASVIFMRDAGVPEPAIRYGSSVCQ
jgi:hypothetical protein